MLSPLCRFLAVIVVLTALVAESGCGKAKNQAVVRRVTPPPGDPLTSPIQTTKQNLSMAKELKEVAKGDYVLGPEDTVEVSVFRRDEMAAKATISASGKISYFLIGDLQAGGLTRFELRDRIQEQLSEYIKDPKVVVNISEYRSHKIFVLGQVRTPGVYRMRNDYSLLEAISAAGGLGPDAYLGGAYVVRDGKILLVNFYELIKKGNTDEDIPLLAGDVIYVPDDKERKVFVLGEVNRQCAIPLVDGLSLLNAIAEAGGFTRDAQKDSVIVMRGNLSKPEVWKIDTAAMDPRVNIPLEQGDIVYVASTTFANVERIALRLYNILQPFYNGSRSIVWGDAAVGVMEGKDSRFIME